jgi:hypothetical protein
LKFIPISENVIKIENWKNWCAVTARLQPAGGAVTAPGSHARRRGGALADGAAMAGRRQGVLGGHEEESGVVPGTSTGVRAPPCGPATVRRGGLGAAVFRSAAALRCTSSMAGVVWEHLGGSKGVRHDPKKKEDGGAVEHTEEGESSCDGSDDRTRTREQGGGGSMGHAWSLARGMGGNREKHNERGANVLLRWDGIGEKQGGHTGGRCNRNPAAACTGSMGPGWHNSGQRRHIRFVIEFQMNSNPFKFD